MTKRVVQLRRVRPVRCRATIHVVAAHRGRACGPGQRHGVGGCRNARARKRDRRWRVRCIACDAYTSAHQPRSRRGELSCDGHGLIRRQSFSGSYAAVAVSRSRDSYARNCDVGISIVGQCRRQRTVASHVDASKAQARRTQSENASRSHPCSTKRDRNRRVRRVANQRYRSSHASCRIRSKHCIERRGFACCNAHRRRNPRGAEPGP